jgi:hypothetical protein
VAALAEATANLQSLRVSVQLPSPLVARLLVSTRRQKEAGDSDRLHVFLNFPEPFFVVRDLDDQGV